MRLKDVKDRILEFLAVRQLTQETEKARETEAAAEAEPTPEPGAPKGTDIPFSYGRSSAK